MQRTISEIAKKMIYEPVPADGRIDFDCGSPEESKMSAVERIILSLEREAIKGNVAAAKELREYLKLKESK